MSDGVLPKSRVFSALASRVFRRFPIGPANAMLMHGIKKITYDQFLQFII